MATLTPSIMKTFLERYGYDATESGCEIIYNTWMQNKASLLEKFRKHPNWDEENLAIVFKETEYERGFDATAFDPFIKWAREERDKMIKREGFNDTKYRYIQDDYHDIRIYAEYAKDAIRRLKNKGIKVNLHPDFGMNDIRRKEELIKAYRNKMQEDRACYYIDDDEYYIPREMQRAFSRAFDALEYMRENCREQFITAEQADMINSYCPVKVSEGLKLTKAVQRVCKTIGLDKVKDIRPAHENTDRLKDWGFNHHFQMLADSINPTKFKRITVISLNPLDYWGMSFGYGWASCMTIDKQNIRRVSSNHYSGCYSGGTESYMLDSSSIIFYVVKEDYQGRTYWDEDKMQRVVFCVNENGSLLLESRVYPDGRDGGDASLAGQFRNAMQKVISELYDVNNYWRVEKGASVCMQNSITKGSHYKDYQQSSYTDVNISFNKDECMEFPKIKIGHETICPCCGEEHESEENIMCVGCLEESEDWHTCDNCGDSIYPNEEYIHTPDGRYFCCSDCAENHDYRQCYDDDEWYYIEELYCCEDDDQYHDEDHCYRDDYNDYYYSGDPEVTTVDGNTYSCEEHAVDDGYEMEYFSDDWMRREDLIYSEYLGAWFDQEHEGVIEAEDGSYYPSERAAEDAGYVETENGDWVLEDDAFCIDAYGVWYKDEDEAREAGYVRTENGEWIDKEDAICIEDRYYADEEEARDAGYVQNEDDEWVVAESEVLV